MKRYSVKVQYTVMGWIELEARDATEARKAALSMLDEDPDSPRWKEQPGGSVVEVQEYIP